MLNNRNWRRNQFTEGEINKTERRQPNPGESNYEQTENKTWWKDGAEILKPHTQINTNMNQKALTRRKQTWKHSSDSEGKVNDDREIKEAGREQPEEENH